MVRTLDDVRESDSRCSLRFCHLFDERCEATIGISFPHDRYRYGIPVRPGLRLREGRAGKGADFRPDGGRTHISDCTAAGLLRDL